MLFFSHLTVLLLEPASENLHISSHDDNEEEEVLGLDDMQNMKDTQKEKAKGEDWEEVSFKF